MASRRLPNYLKSSRNQSGLTQSDMAFLLGAQDGARFSRYEQNRVIPSVRTALALATILKKPVEELFAGLLESVEIETEEKMQVLIRELQEKVAQRATDAREKKLRWLTSNHGALAGNQEAWRR